MCIIILHYDIHYDISWLHKCRYHIYLLYALNKSLISNVYILVQDSFLRFIIHNVDIKIEKID